MQGVDKMLCQDLNPNRRLGSKSRAGLIGGYIVGVSLGGLYQIILPVLGFIIGLGADLKLLKCTTCIPKNKVMASKR